MADQQLKNITQEQESFISKKLLGNILDYWYLFLISLAVCLTIAWFKIHYATPMYKVYAQVLVGDDKSGSSQALTGNGGGLDFSSLISNKTNMANEMAILQTTDLSKRVVYDLNLYINYFHKGSVRTVELYDGSPFKVAYKPDHNIVPATLELKFPNFQSNQFKITAGGKTFPWHFNDTLHFSQASYYFTNTGLGFDPEASYLLIVQDPEGVAGNVASNLTTELQSAKGSILNLTYNTNLPEKGKDILGGVIRAYINRNLDQKNIASDSTIQFINSRIALVGGDLGNIETTIQRFKQENKIADLSTQSQQYITNSNIYTDQLNNLEVQLQVIKTMLDYVQNEQNNRRPVPALLNSDPTFGGLVSSYNAAQVQRDKILLSLKEDNPIASNLDVQIAGLRGDITSSLKSQQQALTASRQKFAAQSNEVNGLIRNVPEQERRFLDYSREQNIKQALYLFLLQRREEIAIAKASNSSNVSIITSPKANYAPYEPNNTALTVGFIVGLLLPSGFIMLKVFLNNKVTSREDVTGATPATILSEIGHSAIAGGVINLKEEGRSIIAEQFRIFRTNMDFALANTKSPVIMITSCVSGEGKSFIAANLGQIYAVSGKRVLLMELDLRRPKLSKMLGMSYETGFSNYIISNEDIGRFIQPVNQFDSSLSILSAGPIPPNPAELLLSDKMGNLITELRQQFDVIIIDTAPIGVVTDAQILGKFADVSLYVVRQGFSIKNSMEIINDVLVNAKLPNLYLILNDVKEGTSYKYGYGYRYGYGYGYGYADKQQKKKWWKK